MTNHPKALMVFTAGFGTRMGLLTKNQPKPLVPVAGQPMIDRALDLVADINLDRIVANLHYKSEMLAAHLTPKGILLSYEPEILETGGGLRAALPLLGEDPVFTLNPDGIWHGSNPLRLLQDAWRPDEMDALLMCIPTAQAVGFQREGDFDIDVSGRINRGKQVVYGGAQIIKTDKLYNIKPNAFSLNLLWDMMLGQERLFALNYPGQWCDIGNPTGLALAEKMLSQNNV